ncbi:phosphate ABC transporter permease subunit PstC [Primorskyibacter sp. S187A]|uniref:phosphate ABC transporter permease subunit PstC n=1 Tax=Primorskyibacter sp. S187A TaxID=3415130 RepID=UPI003C7CA228
MPLIWLVISIIVICAAGYALGRKRALASAGGDARNLHSRPNYYGAYVALCAGVPAIATLGLWLFVQPMMIERSVASLIPNSAVPEGSSIALVMSDVRRTADGFEALFDQDRLSREAAMQMQSAGADLRDQFGEVGVALASEIDETVLSAGQRYWSLSARWHTIMGYAVLAVALLGFGASYARAHKDFRARNSVETGILALLLAAACLAILTTLGIVLSMLFETRNFFGLHSWSDFFFGGTWAPNFRGDSELSILPLLWGTLYISFIALLVAVPIGLFAAIYLSEYASPRTRAFAKPFLEILAGIPTIVYGLFALLVVGPFLFDIFGKGGFAGVEWMAGVRAVITAGVVMGIMLIPFVSSLSDDIINAVPQAMRDGSLGLGATKSETIRQVVLPAALPGIMGAVLLATSRAIGETMIVVLGAGAIAKFSGNPFEAMTTITTRIVSQLTGDGDFSSPETLVAFALGLTLFVLTLGLNVLALYIVRKYREQYE